ncbi:MAG: hypothetical protein V4548_07685 [Bacteroidota bacterium]
MQKLYIGSIIVFILTAIVNLFAWTDLNFAGRNSLCYILFGFVFIFGGLSIYYEKKHPNLIEHELKNPPDEGMSLTPFFKDAPLLIKALFVVCLIDIGLSFFTNSQPNNTSADFINGNYLLKNDEGVIKTITQIEYNKYQTEMVKIFSAGSMLFYSISILIFNRLIAWEKDFPS